MTQSPPQPGIDELSTFDSDFQTHDDNELNDAIQALLDRSTQPLVTPPPAPQMPPALLQPAPQPLQAPEEVLEEVIGLVDPFEGIEPPT